MGEAILDPDISRYASHPNLYTGIFRLVTRHHLFPASGIVDACCMSLALDFSQTGATARDRKGGDSANGNVAAHRHCPTQLAHDERNKARFCPAILMLQTAGTSFLMSLTCHTPSRANAAADQVMPQTGKRTTSIRCRRSCRVGVAFSRSCNGLSDEGQPTLGTRQKSHDFASNFSFQFDDKQLFRLWDKSCGSVSPITLIQV